MKATKVLELLQAGKIKELESELKNEIMLETSNTTGSKAANQKAIFKHLQILIYRKRTFTHAIRTNYQIPDRAKPRNWLL